MILEKMSLDIADLAQASLSTLGNEYRIRVERPLPLADRTHRYQIKLMIPHLRMRSISRESLDPSYELPYDNSDGRVPESASVFLAKSGGKIDIETELYDGSGDLLRYLREQGIAFSQVTYLKKTGDFNYRVLSPSHCIGFPIIQHGLYAEEKLSDGIEHVKQVMRLVGSTCEIPTSDSTWKERIGISRLLVGVGDEMVEMLASMDTLPDEDFVRQVIRLVQYMDIRKEEIRIAIGRLSNLQKVLNIV